MNSSKSQKVTCQFSSDYFAGFKVEVDLSDVQNMKEIVDICKANLLNVLNFYNFEILIREAKKAEFHIHQPDSLAKAKANPLDVIWICDHVDF